MTRGIRDKINDEETIQFLEKVFATRGISNGMILNIPRIGKVTSTSMVLRHYHDGESIPYFSFNHKGRRGEISYEKREYFIEFEQEEQK